MPPWPARCFVTGEFRFGTIRPTFLFTPQRSRVIGAKYLAGLLAGLVFGAIGEALSLGIGAAILSERGVPFALSGGQLTLLVLGTLAGCALFGVIGVAVGAIVRNQVAAVVGLLAWVFIVESLLFGLVAVRGAATCPAQAAEALSGSSAPHALSAAAGGACARGLDGRARGRRCRPGSETRRGVRASAGPHWATTPPE